MINMHTKFEVSSLSHSRDILGDSKSKMGHVTVTTTLLERTRVPIPIRLSRTVFEIISLIFQKLKRSYDIDHAPFRDKLSSEGWDWLRSTHIENVYNYLQQRNERQRQI